MPTDFKLRNVVVDGTIFADDLDDSEMLEVFESVRDTDMPAEFDSQIVNITEDNLSESALIFSDGLPSGPMIQKGSVELVTLSFDDDGDMSITADLSPDFIEVGVDVFDTVLSIVGVHIHDFSVDCIVNAEFAELDFSIEGPDDFEYTGVMFNQRDHKFVVQSSYADSWGSRAEELSSSSELEDTDSEDDDSETEETTAVDARSSGHFDVSESGEFITERISVVENILEGIC